MVTMYWICKCVFNSRNHAMTGPRAGPTQTMTENPAMALPRSSGSQRSARTPGALLSGVETNVPVRKRPIRRLPKFGG